MRSLDPEHMANVAHKEYDWKLNNATHKKSDVCLTSPAKYGKIIQKLGIKNNLTNAYRNKRRKTNGYGKMT